MKIGIFGDSYSSTYGYEQRVKLYPSWSFMLSENYDVRNFSKNGSSLYYMKLLFDKHQQDFDKIIFCITAPGRLEFKVDTLKNNSKYDPWYQHIPTIHIIQSRLTIPELTELDKKRYKILYEYLLEIQDIERERYYHAMLVKDIVNQRPDTILIPAFPTSLTDQTDCLESITKFEDKILNKKTGFYRDSRPCHMSLENNKIIFNNVNETIVDNNNRINLDIKQFKEPPIGNKILLRDNI
jgi:hypothetical protein